MTYDNLGPASGLQYSGQVETHAHNLQPLQSSRCQSINSETNVPSLN
jgi:hypothetical protein